MFLKLTAMTLGLGTPAWALDSSLGALTVTPVVSGLSAPWAFGFLPEGGLIITERGGRLLHVADGAVRAVAGLPEIAVQGQGGLLDVLVPRDFAEQRELFLSYSAPQEGRGAGTAVYRARLSEDGTRLEDGRQIFAMTPGSRGGRHFGSRLVEAPDGTIFVTVGERGDRPSAQDLERHNGSVVRITRDGAPAPQNPFVDRSNGGPAGALPEIWSYGHRNPQGAALDPEGQLWVAEHGAQGGDEVNRITPGTNYGWPVISYGRHYSGAKIGEGSTKPGMAQPDYYWDPSIAPSGMTFYQGDLFKDWQGDAFVGSLKFNYIARLSGDPLEEVERLQSPETQRVRDLRTGPAGALWFLSEPQGTLFKITP